MRLFYSTMSKRACIGTLALSSFLYGCSETPIPKSNKPDPSVVAKKLAEREIREQKTREAYAAKDIEFIGELNNIDIYQEDNTFYKDVEILANKVQCYNTIEVLFRYEHDALPKFFKAFEEFSINNLKDFKPQYSIQYETEPLEQWQKDKNESLKLNQLVGQVERYCRSKLRVRLH